MSKKLKHEYTEGVCGDGAAILEDGVQITVTKILSLLNTRSKIEEMAIMEWISIEDELPLTDGVTPTTVWIYQAKAKRVVLSEYDHGWDYTDVSHWMYPVKPEQPKE